MTKRYEYVLFDWDGCIAQTLDVWPTAQVESFRDYGIEVTFDEAVRSCRGTWQFLSEQFGIPEEKGHEIFAHTRDIVKTRHEDVKLYPEVAEILQKLVERGKKLAIVTSSFTEAIRGQMAATGLDPTLFRVIVTGDDVTQHKPHPESMYRALELLGATPDEALMIGDTDKDILLGKHSDVDTVLVFYPEHTKYYDRAELEAQHPDYAIERFRDLLDIVR